MKFSEGDIGDLVAALVAVQADLGNIPATARNQHFKHSYAPLSSVLETVRPALAKHDVVILQDVRNDDGAVVVITRLIHTSGAWCESEVLTLPVETEAQELGSTISYLRRYSVLSLLALASAADDDDGARSGGPAQGHRQQAAKAPDVYVQEKCKAIRAMLIKIVGDDDQERLDAELLRITANDKFNGWQSLDRIKSKKAADITHANVERVMEDLDLDDADAGDPDGPPPLSDDEIPF